MAFNPALPLANSEIASAVLRDQFNGLKTLLDAVAAGAVTPAQLTSAINAALATAAGNSSANSNAVGTLGQGADENYNQTQMQQVMDKLDELITALRR